PRRVAHPMVRNLAQTGSKHPARRSNLPQPPESRSASLASRLLLEDENSSTSARWRTARFSPTRRDEDLERCPEHPEVRRGGFGYDQDCMNSPPTRTK